MIAKLWADDAGIVAMEYLFVATIVGLGLVVGLSNLEAALNSELTELANAIGGLSQEYSIRAQSGCVSFKGGSSVSDSPGTLTFTASAVTPTVIDVSICP
jgi:Flp pilus assembly pilin Flp